jgi:hypothetical protein
MKKLLIISLFALCSCSLPEERLYCGKVTDKYRTTAGYKTSEEKHIVFFSDSLKRKVDIQVTDNCYANTELKETVCFTLREYQVK